MGLQPGIATEITRLIEERTHQRLKNLTVEVDRDAVVLRGRAHSFHIKQLAQHGVMDLLPGVRVLNAIEVAS